MGRSVRRAPDPWWLVAGPVTGIVGGVALGALSGWLTTPTGGVGPLVGDQVASTVLGAAVGLTVGVSSGVVVGLVLMLTVPRERPTTTARLFAAVVAAVCCPAVLLALADVGRVARGQLGTAPLAGVAVAGALTFAWLAGRAPCRPD